MNTLELFRQLTISTLLGLLVGLQRQRTDSELAGFRTFPLITMFGTLCGVLSQSFNYPWLLAAGFAGIVAVIVVGNLPKLHQPNPDTGVTTELAVLVMFAVGALVVVKPWIIAVAVTGAVAVLLQMKPQLHGFAAKVGDRDFKAILQFVLITFIVLPILDDYNRNFNPFALLAPYMSIAGFENLNVLNPYEIWLLVVLVVSISLGGYISYKIFGQRAGVVLGGILGGTISSTATTVSYSRRTVRAPDAVRLSAVAIMIASTMTYVRVLVEVVIVAPTFLQHVALPLLIIFGASLAVSAAAWYSLGNGQNEMPPQDNPTELKSALVFALMYAVIVVLFAVAKEKLNENSLYALAALSGMTDMDAITLSVSRLVESSRLGIDVGWQLIVVGIIANLFFKALIVAFIGHRNLLRTVALLFGIVAIAGFAVLAFWR